VEQHILELPDMRLALSRRDIKAVYRLLQKHGYSQRYIAALTGQSQSEVSEVMGTRCIVSYPVLERIFDGLEVPRGYVGMAYDYYTQVLVMTTADYLVDIRTYVL
jgi:transcriptional regulator with XRE-family HTH domain